MLHSLVQCFKEGGWGMWSLSAELLLALLIFAEHLRVLFRERVDHTVLLLSVRTLSLCEAPERAVALCVKHPSAVARMMLAARHTVSGDERDSTTSKKPLR
jgi:hypothetical protein